MKKTPRLYLFIVVASILVYLLLAIKRESFAGKNGSGYNVGLQTPVLGLVAVGVVIVGALVYMIANKSKIP